jgi:hypothetical protein
MPVSLVYSCEEVKFRSRLSEAPAAGFLQVFIGRNSKARGKMNIPVDFDLEIAVISRERMRMRSGIPERDQEKGGTEDESVRNPRESADRGKQ